MKLHVVWIAGLLACGSVRNEPGQLDASTTDDAAMSCAIHDTIDSCGPQCAKCAPADDRQMPVCNGTMCDVACNSAAPKCTDNTCSRLTWNFDSNMLDGITPRAPNGLQLAVRNHAGNVALAIDVTNLTEVSFTIPICLSGTVQLQTRTLTASVYFDGDSTNGTAQYYVQGSMPAPMDNAFLTTISLPSLTYVPYSTPLSMSQFSNTATTMVFQAGTLGQHFSGTIWFDDIKIQ
ncbi:MAG TPA: hypothetical protein VHT91_43880 [Kofleriaceae bacterium]|nr:hypothetical protein [Kofleriaceae bacterium]